MTALTDELVGRIEATYRAAADPTRAGPMKAYMRDQFPFLGIQAGERRALLREAQAGLPRLAEADLIDAVDRLYALDEREFHQAATDLVGVGARGAGPPLLGPIERWILTKSWWDTVDVLCRHGAGEIVRRNPGELALMERWLASDELWLIRSAILHQERWRSETRPDVLFRFCLTRADHPDFFVRKAIGWALRSYAHTDAAAVRAFVAAHDVELAGLSKREALKRIPPLRIETRAG